MCTNNYIEHMYTPVATREAHYWYNFDIIQYMQQMALYMEWYSLRHIISDFCSGLSLDIDLSFHVLRLVWVSTTPRTLSVAKYQKHIEMS